MDFQEVDSDLHRRDPLEAETITHQQERLIRLQYMIAFLIEKNEQMRQELSAKSHED